MPVRVSPPEPVHPIARAATFLAKVATLPLVFGISFLFAGCVALFAGAIADTLHRGSGSLVVSLVFLALMAIPLREPLTTLYRRLMALRAPPPSEPESAPPPSPDAVELGTRLDSDRAELLVLEPALRARHLYLVGKTRTGKTTLLRNLLIQDMQHGHGVGFIDPHGDAAEELLGSVPADRVADVIYFDPTSPHAPAFNLLALPYPPAKLTEDIIAAFKMFFADSWGPRLEHLLRYGILTLLTDTVPHTLRDLRALYINADVRAAIVGRATNATLREFWTHEFPTIPASACNPLINKLSALLVPTSPLERLFSSTENHLDFTRILNDGRIFIANLSKGTLGEEPSRLLGGLLTAAIQQAALARAELAETARRPFFFYVDEFHNYTVASFETILAESAKYRLHLTLANQALGQLPQSLERAIFGNVATIISFQVSAEDAPQLRREMHRSRILVRPRETNTFLPLRAFIAAQKQIYRQALSDRWAGLPRDERQRMQGAATVAGLATPFGGFFAQWNLHTELAARKAEIARVLTTLGTDTLDVRLMRELFPDYEFREIAFPEVDDFLNLPPHHAFCRMERAENVAAFRASLPPRPEAAVRAAILARQEARSRASVAPRAPLAVPSPAMPPPREHAASPATSQPRTDDDYTY